MTFCIAIHAELTTDVCPLDKGRCFWQHKETKSCMFTTDELTVEQFCSRTGLTEVPTKEQCEQFINKLKTELQA